MVCTEGAGSEGWDLEGEVSEGCSVAEEAVLEGWVTVVEEEGIDAVR